jgi:hypothetical protein
VRGPPYKSSKTINPATLRPLFKLAQDINIGIYIYWQRASARQLAYPEPASPSYVHPEAATGAVVIKYIRLALKQNAIFLRYSCHALNEKKGNSSIDSAVCHIRMKKELQDGEGARAYKLRVLR